MPGPRIATLTGRWRALPDSFQDAVIAAAFLAGGVLMLLSGFGRITGGPDPVPGVRLALLAAVCVLQTQRRRYPIPTLLAAVALLGVDSLLGLTLPILLVVTDLIHAAILYSSPAGSRIVVRITLLAAAAVVVAVAVLTGDPRSTVLAAMLAAALLLLPLQSSSALRHQRERAAWERERVGTHQHLVELEHAARLARERAATARELHDVIAGHLSSIALQTSALTGADADRVPAEQRSTALRTMRTSSLQALSSLQTMITTLRRTSDATDPDSVDGRALDPLPVTLHSDLDQLVDRFRAGGAELVVVLQPDPLPRLPALIDQVAYRVVAEALTNASRHGADLPTDLRISATREQLTIRVRSALLDRSAPTDRSGAGGIGTGHGLSNLLGRVTAAGGRFSTGVDEGRWSVDCLLPLQDSA